MNPQLALWLHSFAATRLALPSPLRRITKSSVAISHGRTATITESGGLPRRKNARTLLIHLACALVINRLRTSDERGSKKSRAVPAAMLYIGFIRRFRPGIQKIIIQKGFGE